MKIKSLKLLYLITFSFFLSNLKAQTACDTPFNCSINLKIVLFSDVTIIHDVPYFKHPKHPEDFNECNDVKYKTAEYGGMSCPAPTETLCEPNTSLLVYDVYYPTYHKFFGEDGCGLPAFIFFHAGSYKECSAKDKDISVEICTEFAKRGFVAYSVEYRRGKKDDAGVYRSVQNQLAQYRAAQDARGAIRSIIKRQQNEVIDDWNDPYSIDIDKIFIGDASAGGVPANLATWYTSSMVYEAFPSPSGSPTIQTVLGSIDADYYYGDPTYNYHPKIKALLNCWSGLSLPTGLNASGSDFFSGSGRSAFITPVIAFHGKNDDVFHFLEDGDQEIFFSPSSGNHAVFNPEDTCINSGPYVLNGSSGSADMIQTSSLNMYHIAGGLWKGSRVIFRLPNGAWVGQRLHRCWMLY